MSRPTYLLFCFLILVYIDYNFACNEAVCASIVSKCLITNSCKCNLKNCTCCKECFTCLSHLYSECCSCLEMCPKPNHTTSALSKKSHVEHLPEPIPTLFQSLVLEPDSLNRWFTLTYPFDIDVKALSPEYRKDIILVNNEQEVNPMKDRITLNCSVAFMSQCMSSSKCKASCQSMGANSFRWFHDGCCECVGDKCYRDGISESRCLQCPIMKEIILPDAVDTEFSEDVEDVSHHPSNNSTIAS